MADTEGIRSSFSTQLAPRSPKLRIYEYLFLLNQKLQEAVQILKRLEKCSWLRRDFLRSFQVEVEDLRAQTNFEVIEHMSDREQHDWAHFGKLRRKWDQQFEDPDDVYLKAEQREEERRSKDCRLGSASSLTKRSLPKRLVWMQNTGAGKGAAGSPGNRWPHARVKHTDRNENPPRLLRWKTVNASRSI